jgi:tetratricopeptide (TPR) repeat protein
MIRVLICLAGVLAASAVPAAAAGLAEDWLKVQQALVVQDGEEFTTRSNQLKTTAAELQANRLTPYAESLVLWADKNPGALAEAAVRTAREMDQELPSTYFLTAKWRWRSGDYLASVQSYLAGWWAVFLFEPTRRMMAAGVAGWALLALGWTLVLAAATQALFYLPRLVHDAGELARLVLRPVNAAVLAAAIVLLPLLGGFGPVWLAMYLFALSWGYMSFGRRVAAVVATIVMALVIPTLVMWQTAMLRWPSLLDRSDSMLAERRIDFPTLREFADLESSLKDVPEFHLVLGELHRMHGEIDLARIDFQRTNLLNDRDPLPLIFLGNLSLEDGDVQLAIEQYSRAIELEANSALAYRNLSVAYDQSRRFQDGDAARNTAKDIAGEGWETVGLRGRDPRIRFPRLGSAQIRDLARNAPPDVRLKAGAGPLIDRLIAEILSPWSMVFWIPGVLGLLALMARDRWMWTAQMCSKCGKVFCPRCKTETGSDTLCSQCISVFLKRDVVAVDQQTAKAARVRRWGMWTAALRRVAGLLIPGGQSLLTGNPLVGYGSGFVAWFCLAGALLWAPMVLPGLEPFASPVPVQVLLLLVFLVVWLRGALVAWMGS